MKRKKLISFKDYREFQECKDDPRYGLDLEFLRESAINLFHKRRVLESALPWFQKKGYLINHLHCDTWKNDDDAFDAIHHEFKLDMRPSNYNALDEVLGFIKIPKKSGRLVILWKFDRFHDAEED